MISYFEGVYVHTFAAPIILGKRYEEQPSGLWPNWLKGVWNVAYSSKKVFM